MGLESDEEGVDTFEEAIVDYALIFVGFDFVLSFGASLVDLVLLRADEGAFVDVGMHFYVGVVAEFESVLRDCQP